MAIAFDNNDSSDNSVGIAFMEGLVGTHDVKPTYTKFLKQPEYKSKTGTMLWAPPLDSKKREDAYPADFRASHEGARLYGHTALILRKGGRVTKMVGFVPAGKSWPCPGTWMDNLGMVHDPMALSYEVRSDKDAVVMDETMTWLGTARDEWKFRYDFPKQGGFSAPDTYNCIAAALAVLIRKTTETKDYWERLNAYCKAGDFGQSKVKIGIMTGDFLV